MSDFGEDLRNKCMDFSVRIVELYKQLVDEQQEYVLSKQLLRSGTSIGANLAEAQSAISGKDFIAKVYISLKETSESLYWIELLFRTQYLSEEAYESYRKDCEELKRLFVSITKTYNENARKNNSKKNNSK